MHPGRTHFKLAVFATTAAAVAVLSAFAPSLGGAFTVVGKVAPGALAAFATCLRRLFTVVGEIAWIVLCGTTLAATIALVVSHDLSPHVVTQESLCSTPTSSRERFAPRLCAWADGLRERTRASICGAAELCSPTFGTDPPCVEFDSTIVQLLRREWVIAKPTIIPSAAAPISIGVLSFDFLQPPSILLLPLGGSKRLPDEVSALGLRFIPRRVSHPDNRGRPGTR